MYECMESISHIDEEQWRSVTTQYARLEAALVGEGPVVVF